MTIKAILLNGVIHPIDPLPTRWSDGQELVIEEPDRIPTEAELQDRARDLEIAIAQIPAEEHDRFLDAIANIERESKEAVRREWGIP